MFLSESPVWKKENNWTLFYILRLICQSNEEVSLEWSINKKKKNIHVLSDSLKVSSAEKVVWRRMNLMHVCQYNLHSPSPQRNMPVP